MLQTLPLRYSPSPQAQRQGALLSNKNKAVVEHLNSVLALPKNSPASLDKDLYASLLKCGKQWYNVV
jgi:hypothetical protein